jgi:tRNA(adenine34) deaminase
MPYRDLAIRSQELHRKWDERRGVNYVVSDIVDH